MSRDLIKISVGPKRDHHFTKEFPPKYLPFCYRWLWESRWSSEMMKMLIRSVNYQVGETAAAVGLSGTAVVACRRNGSSRNNEGVFTCCDELGSAWLSGKWRGGVETQRGTLINLGANAIGFPSKSRLYQMKFAPEQPQHSFSSPSAASSLQRHLISGCIRILSISMLHSLWWSWSQSD